MPPNGVIAITSIDRKAGRTTVAAAIAGAALRAGASTLLISADPHSGVSPTTTPPSSDRFTQRSARGAKAAAAALEEGRADHDVVVIDLPPMTTDCAAAVSKLAEQTIIVIPPAPAGVSAARRASRFWPSHERCAFLINHMAPAADNGDDRRDRIMDVGRLCPVDVPLLGADDGAAPGASWPSEQAETDIDSLAAWIFCMVEGSRAPHT